MFAIRDTSKRRIWLCRLSGWLFVFVCACGVCGWRSSLHPAGDSCGGCCLRHHAPISRRGLIPELPATCRCYFAVSTAAPFERVRVSATSFRIDMFFFFTGRFSHFSSSHYVMQHPLCCCIVLFLLSCLALSFFVVCFFRFLLFVFMRSFTAPACLFSHFYACSQGRVCSNA